MSMFRSPLYLDTATLVPLANYHDIEVMVDVQVSQRDLGQQSGKAGFRASLPLPASPGVEAGGSRGSESEVTQARTVKDTPASALNRLLDRLELDNGVVTDLSAQTVTKRQLVELDGEWEVAPATDVGAFLAGLVNLMVQHPNAMTSAEPPAEFMSLMTAGPQGGSIVLDRISDDPEASRTLVLLDAENFVRGSTMDDLEGERTVFGSIDTLVGEDQDYSLEKFFMSGISRAVRRMFDPAELLQGVSEGFGRSLSVDDLRLKGPLVVVKAVAVY